MATVNKDFKVKQGLIVEGTTGTINNYDILTKKTDDQDYIIGLIGGSSDSANTPNTVVKRDGDGNFAAGEITADLVGNVTGQVSDISNHDTNDLAEGSTNKYFTNQRALDATASAYDPAGRGAAAEQVATAYADSLISTEVTNRNSAIATAKSEAISTSESYTDSAISTEVTNRNSAIATAKSEAISTASSDATTKANAAEANANDYTDTAITNLNLAGTYDALGAAADALADANTYTDGKVSDLVNSAPAMLDTLGELATALQDNPDIISDLQNIAAGKQGTLTAGEGIYIDGDNVITGRQQSGGGLKFVWNEAAIDRSTVDGWYDASGAAATAQSNAESYADNAAEQAFYNAQSYADGLAGNYDAAGAAAAAQTAAEATASADATTKANAAQSNAETFATNAINALNTDDIEEGSVNLYFEDSRAKSSAADLLTSANLTNITISGNGAGLTITAENGVSDSTTDDLEEGINNLYFTDQRAVNALQAVTPQFQEVDITWATKQTATYTYVATASTATVMSWATNYASAKFLVRVRSGNHSQVSEVLVTADNSNNLAITEYALVGTNGNLGNVSATLSGGSYNLTVQTTENNSEVIVFATLMAYGD